MVASGKTEDITLVVITEASLIGNKEYVAIMQAAVEECATKKDRFALLEEPHPEKAGEEYMGAIPKFWEGMDSLYRK